MYSHTQFGKVTSYSLGGAALLVGTMSLYSQELVSYIVLIVLVISYLLFHNLTVKIESGCLKAIFGIGIITKKTKLSKIKSCEIVKTPWWYGYGIRWAGHCWLYNVSGLYSVEITLKNNKQFRIGTDDPHTLKSRVNELIKS